MYSSVSSIFIIVFKRAQRVNLKILLLLLFFYLLRGGGVKYKERGGVSHLENDRTSAEAVSSARVGRVVVLVALGCLVPVKGG